MLKIRSPTFLRPLSIVLFVTFLGAAAVQGKGVVTVTIPVMGAYSPTWPLNCPKSDKIVRNLADLIAREGKGEWGSVLFLLSTGEEKDLDVVRGWMNAPINTAPTWMPAGGSWSSPSATPGA